MQNTLLEKYIEFKKKTFLSYSSVFFKLFPANEQSIWKDETEYENILIQIFDTYFSKYYFKDIDEIKQLNKKEYSKDEFKLALSLAIIADTYKEKYSELKEKYKTGLYDLTAIIYMIVNIDRDINVLSESISLNSILDIIRSYFKFIDKEKIMNKNPFIIEILGNKIKDSTRLIRRFFDTIDSKEAFNLFAKYDNDYYFVDFDYNNDLLDKYKSNDVERVYEKYNFKEEFLEVSYELAFVTLLKEFSIGKKVKKLILPITANYLKDSKHIDIIQNIFGNGFINTNIKFSILYSEYQKNRDIFNVLRDMGFKLVLYMDKNEMILDYSNIRIDLSIYAEKRFVDNNPKFLDFTYKENIECQIVENKTYISELELLKKCEEE